MSEGGFPEPVTVAFEVPFVAGQSRPRLTSRPFPHAVKPARDSERERAVAAAFDEALAALGRTAPLAPKGVAVTVSVLCERPLPKTAPRRLVRQTDTGKPDADNVAKLVLDALNGHAWEDDSQVTSLCVSKMPRTRRDGVVTRVEVFCVV